jgi:hypothetical protein
VVLVYAHGEEAYPIIPAEDYCICPCDRAWAEFFRKAIASHPQVREWDWHNAIALLQNETGKAAGRTPHRELLLA